MRKAEDVVIYRDELWYSSFPSVVSRVDGELLVAFRRAPDRRVRYGASGCTHADPNSNLVLVRSSDSGQTWSSEPEQIHTHPCGGSQDPCMLQLADGSIVCASYLWTMMSEGDNRPGHVVRVLASWDMGALGGYLVHSEDAGRTWSAPVYPPAFEDDTLAATGSPRPPLNRGAMVQASDGCLYWAVVRTPQELGHTVLELLVSEDGGISWTHRSHLAGDESVVMNETSLIQTVGGDLVAFVRTASFGDHGLLVRSRDMGATWEPWEDLGVVGHPYHAVRLPCGHVLIAYGYRHEPFGIRVRVMDPECIAFVEGEIVLRADGGNTDIGYPWACVTPEGRVLVTYYINHGDGTRYIAGTFLAID